MKKVLSVMTLVITILSLMSCTEDDNKSSEAGTIILEFDARVGTANLELNTTDYPYENNLNQEYKVTKLKYYISQIKLWKEDGTYVEDPIKEDGSKGYYLIDESEPESTEILLTGIPSAKYTHVEFTVGVDANQVAEGAQVGPLDPVHGLFWNWNAGYVFLAFEGESPASTETNHVLEYHVGGYKSDPSNTNLTNNIKVITLSLDSELVSVNSHAQPEVHIVVDVKKFFEGNSNIDFSFVASVHSPAGGTSIAENYVNAFVVDHVHQ